MRRPRIECTEVARARERAATPDAPARGSATASRAGIAHVEGGLATGTKPCKASSVGRYLPTIDPWLPSAHPRTTVIRGLSVDHCGWSTPPTRPPRPSRRPRSSVVCCGLSPSRSSDSGRRSEPSSPISSFVSEHDPTSHAVSRSECCAARTCSDDAGVQASLSSSWRNRRRGRTSTASSSQSRWGPVGAISGRAASTMRWASGSE